MPHGLEFSSISQMKVVIISKKYVNVYVKTKLVLFWHVGYEKVVKQGNVVSG